MLCLLIYLHNKYYINPLASVLSIHILNHIISFLFKTLYKFLNNVETYKYIEGFKKLAKKLRVFFHSVK